MGVVDMTRWVCGQSMLNHSKTPGIVPIFDVIYKSQLSTPMMFIQQIQLDQAKLKTVRL